MIKFKLRGIYWPPAKSCRENKTTSVYKYKERCCLVFPSSTKREIRHFHLVIAQRRQSNVQKKVMHVQSCCFANLNVLLFCRSHRSGRHRFLSYPMITGVFFAWACATAEQAMCMEAHYRVCLHQNGASQSYHSDYFALWSWRMCSWFNKMCSLQKNSNIVSKAKYHELLLNFISRLDLDNSARICVLVG